jgi:hypothetical protein
MEFHRGIVEDNNDPDKMSRVKVRVIGIHTPNNENTGVDFDFVTTDDLPWAEVMGGTGMSLISGVGLSSVLRQGTWVWVIFDHGNVNKPIVVGSIIGKCVETPKEQYKNGKGFFDPDEEYPFTIRAEDETDINRLARNEKLSDEYYDEETSIYSQKETIHKIINDNVDIQTGITDGVSGADVSQTEPDSLNDSSEYPDVNIIETHSGHTIEFDDTDGNERIRVYHTSGSYIEIRPDGTFVQKSVNTDAESHYIHMSDVHQHIKKNVKRYIEENLDEIINKNVKRNIKENLDEHIGVNFNKTVDGNVVLTVGGNLTWDITGNITINSGGTQTNTNGGNYTHIAPRIDLNP